MSGVPWPGMRTRMVKRIVLIRIVRRGVTAARIVRENAMLREPALLEKTVSSKAMKIPTAWRIAPMHGIAQEVLPVTPSTLNNVIS